MVLRFCAKEREREKKKRESVSERSEKKMSPTRARVSPSLSLFNESVCAEAQERISHSLSPFVQPNWKKKVTRASPKKKRAHPKIDDIRV